MGMEYRAALRRLLGLVDFERMTFPSGERVRYDLARMEALLLRLGNPHQGIPTVHIAGTKGKGSTAAMCSSILCQQGYRTGLYTSPHMHTFRERICLDGTPVDEGKFIELMEEVWPALEWLSTQGGHGDVTLFETLTAMAFCCFRKRADFQVLEVGLGGRLDATNLVKPDVCAITSLSLDHTAILGNTLQSIAAEKASIIKPGAAVVSSPQQPEAMEVVESVCRDKGAELIRVGQDLRWRRGAIGTDGQGVEVQGRLGNYHLWTPLLGEYQLENLATAVGVMECLTERGFAISTDAIDNGLRQVSWPCRIEVLRQSPLVVCDGAHNPYSASRLRDSLPAYFDYLRVVLIIGVSLDKNLEGIVEELAAMMPWMIIVTKSRHTRAAPTQVLEDAFLPHAIRVCQVEGVEKAVARALEVAGEDDLVLATGSLFVAAEVREVIKGIEPELYPKLSRQS